MSHRQEFERVRVILFDAVDTLLTPVPPVDAVYYQAGSESGSRYTRGEIGGRFKSAYLRHHLAARTSESQELLRWRSVVADVFDDVVEDQDRLFARLWEYFSLPSAWQVYPEVMSVWGELEQRGFVLGIASNFDSRLLSICEALPPLDRAQHVFCSSKIGFSKPSREFFLEIARQLRAEPREILLVGDSRDHDVAPARAAGWHALWVNRTSRGVDTACLSTDTIRSLGELPGALPSGTR